MTALAVALDELTDLGTGFNSASMLSVAAGAFERFDYEAGAGGGVPEGPRWRLELAPGVLAVRSFDLARRERALERAERARVAGVDALAAAALAGRDVPGGAVSARRVRRWSAKSRARMVQRLAQLDYSAWLGAARPVMITLTYPGDWRTVAPSAAVTVRHLNALRKRFERHYGVPLWAVWKREFQRRGAPHFHLLIAHPDDSTHAERFPEWLARVWSEIVAHPDAWERYKHRQAGTGVDFAEGARALDPRRLAVYFAKHGAYSAKEYQNDAPWEWLHTAGCSDSSCEGCALEGIGRFWGVWGLRPAVVSVDVSPEDAAWAFRTLRRLARSRAYYAPKRVWRKVQTVDRDTGEIGFRWRARMSNSRRQTLRKNDGAGFLLVNDGAETAVALGIALAARRDRPGPAPARGFGPLGKLP